MNFSKLLIYDHYCSQVFVKDMTSYTRELGVVELRATLYDTGTAVSSGATLK